MSDGFSFGGKEPTPSSATALTLAAALLNLLDARDALEKAREQVPDYTGQWDGKDYYADELERYYRAADDYERAIQASMETK